MADELDKLLGQTDPVVSGAGTDELDKILGGGQPPVVAPPVAPPAPAAPTLAAPPVVGKAPALPVDEYSNPVVQMTPPEPDSLDAILGQQVNKGYLDIFAGGAKRNWGQMEAMVPSLQSVYHDLQGDQEKALEHARNAQAIEQSYGDSEYKFSNIRSADDFGRWLTEKMGEQSVTMLSMMLTGGVGGLAAKSAVSGMLARGTISKTTARMLVGAGSGVGAYPLAFGMETAGTSQELFDVTKQVQSGSALTAGALKGMLEIWAPLSISRSLLTPGLQLGKSIPGAIFKTGLKEGATEGAQEAIDIMFRKIHDPGYDILGTGPTPWYQGQGVDRLLESTAAGFFVGGIYGGPAGVADRGIKRNTNPNTGAPEMAPGTRTVIPAEPIIGVENTTGMPGGPPPIPTFKPTTYGMEARIGPVSEIRRMLTRELGGDKDVRAAMPQTALDDAFEASPLMKQELGRTADQYLDHLDAKVDRYVVQKEDGSLGSRVFTNTELELDNVMFDAQHEKPKKVYKVLPGSLQPAALTATVFDLNKDVWFLPGTDPALRQSLMQKYEVLRSSAESSQEAALANTNLRTDFEYAFTPVYQELLKQGLRVIPTRGSGFHYSGGVQLEEAPYPSSSGRSAKIGLYYHEDGMVSEFKHTQGVIGGEHYLQTLPPRTEGSGLVVSLDMNKLRPEDYKISADGNIRLTHPLRLDTLIPGVEILPLVKGDHFAQGIETTGFAMATSMAGIHVTMEVHNPEYIALGRRMARIAHKFEPIFRQIFKDLNLNYVTQVRINDALMSGGTGPTIAQIWLQHGMIEINPEGWTKVGFPTDEGLEAVLFQTIAHEIGHQLTYFFWNRLPNTMQEQLLYAWNKAALARRMDYPSGEIKNLNSTGDLRAANPIGLQSDPYNPYYNTLPEWLAEQFRRWMENQPEVRNKFDATLREGAMTLEKFYSKVLPAKDMMGDLNLRNPDFFFSAAMDYLKGIGHEKPGMLQSIKRWATMTSGTDMISNAVVLSLRDQAEAAIKSMSHLLPKEVELKLNEKLDQSVYVATDQAVGRFVTSPSHMPFIELAMGALASKGVGGSKQIFAHELYHAYESLGIILPKEIKIIDQEIARLKFDPFSSAEKQTLKNYLLTQEQKYGWEQGLHEALYESKLAEEKRAYFMQWMSEGILQPTDPVKSIFQRLMDILERIRNYIEGMGYKTIEDVSRALYKGEMLERHEARQEQAQTTEFLALATEQRSDQISKVEEVEPGVLMNVSYEGGELRRADGRLFSPSATYVFTDWKDQKLGTATLVYHLRKGYEIINLQAFAQGRQFAQVMLRHLSKDSNIPLWRKDGNINPDDPGDFLLKPPHRVSKMAMPIYKWWGRGKPLNYWLDYFVYSDKTEHWYSPNHVRRELRYWKMMKTMQKAGRVTPMSPEVVEEKIGYYKKLEDKVPKAAWKDPYLDLTFSLGKTFMRDGTQLVGHKEAMRRGDAEFAQMIGQPSDQRFGPSMEEVAEVKRDLAQGERARASGLPFELSAPPTMMSESIGKIFRAVGAGYGQATLSHSPDINRMLVNTLHEADRITKFSSYWLNIKQLAQKNEHLEPLREYVQYGDIMRQIGQEWVRRAEETIRDWELNRDSKQREAIARVFFDLNNMEYLTPQERQIQLTRVPAGWQVFLAGATPMKNSELEQFFTQRGLKRSDYGLIRRVANDFGAFLDQVEAVRQDKINTSFIVGTQEHAVATAKLQSEMADLRIKPYFPMMRFGEFTMSLWYDNGKGKKSVVHFEAFERQVDLENAVRHAKRANPGLEIQIGRVPESVMEFMGMPGPLLRLIREKMNADGVGLTADQLAWIEQFEMANAPDKTFAKRWMPTTGTPGHSLDAMRAYASYFHSGSRYLARLTVMDKMKGNIERLRQDYRDAKVGNTSRRELIHKYMNDHFRYIMEPGRDSGKFRAVVSQYQLGFSPTAAAMNLTQIFTTITYLTSHFGALQTTKQLRHLLGSWKHVYNLHVRHKPIAAPTTPFLKARVEALNQGVINVGQAAELGAYAEGGNMWKLFAGDGTQKFLRGATRAGMWMFAGVEQYNREVTFRAAFELGMQNQNVKRMQQIWVRYPLERSNLVQRGFTDQEALAFLFAKEAVERTQFSFDKFNDPGFMRKPMAKDLLIFFKYTQGMLNFLGSNGKANLIHYLAIHLALYGMMGMPGAEDANELLKMLGRMLGKDWDVNMRVRKYVRELTQGTVLDKVGPDLAIHGISRYGLGLSLLPETWGVPQFDVSANGSMGRIVPGLAEFAGGVGSYKKTSDIVSDTAQKMAGAGYGSMFALMKWLNEPPGTAESKKWEGIMPRALKGPIKTYRYLQKGGETDSTGAMLVKFDPTDWADLTTLITLTLGAQPRKVNAVWEQLREQRDVLDAYQARRVTLYAQLYHAAQVVKDPRVVDDVIKAMIGFNNEVIEIDPSMVLKPAQIRQALHQRMQTKEMQEQFLARNRAQVPVSQRIQNLFPDSALRKVVK